MRETLEVQAASLAAERSTAEQLARIQEELARMEAALMVDDLDELVASDTGVHDSIADASGNSILAQTLRSLSRLVMESRRAVWAIPGHPRRSVPEHIRVVQAIVARDREAAAKAMFKHVRMAREDVAGALTGGISLTAAEMTYGKSGQKGVEG
jgi:DNA-binding FadR family transcriptional regulator